MKRFLKWTGNIITAVLLLGLLLVTYFSISAKLSGEAPKVFGHELMTVLSGSMEPVIHTGSVIVVNPAVDISRLQVGDIITFRSPEDKDKIITHRILSIEGVEASTRFTTKGDANNAEDPKPIPVSNVVGKYANITIPYLGYTLAFAKSKIGVISLLIVPGALLILWQLVSLFRAISHMEKEKAKPDEPLTVEDLRNNV
ncbi:signal peptidase I [Paradesulfitobacterium aromaticivorans]